MELYKREHLISRIAAGYIPVTIKDKRYKVYHPDNDIALQASELYIDEYEKAIESELFDDEDILNLLVGLGLWTDEKENELLKIVPGHIEYWKIELYEKMLQTKTQRQIRKYLDIAKKEYSKLYAIRHSFDSITRAGYANYVKNMYAISKSTRYKGKKVNWDKVDLNAIMNKYYSSLVGTEVVRMLARTHPWNGVWPVLKTNGKIFDNTFLTTEQQALISWSNMYDKIYESPDCPSDEVINDDDMLDGWLLIQKRKRESSRQKAEMETKLGGKLGNADDVFLMAETPEDAQKIDILNDPHMSKIKKERMNQVKSASGEVLEQQLSDVKKKRSMLLRQAFSKNVKGR